ncbi:hypothetical protein [Nitrospirillum amazonense]|uniref:hypothetical protein n=1 Tax=Nitrospirillum amazonense TaxID=28077 RepID=UPI002412CC61|nr:hypothetical protein [Nitrospirillum amazonense]MDG3444683.1 hypothetical protein [Nitrospirillum amazonense]
MSDQRKCPVEGCPVHIDGGHLMCRAHWLRVPGWLRRRITTAWRDYRAIRRSTDHAEVLAAIRTHRVVADQALAFVQAVSAPSIKDDLARGVVTLLPPPWKPQPKSAAERAHAKKHAWPGPGPAPARWETPDGTIVYRDYAAYCD